MKYEIHWRLRATNSAARFLEDDPEGLHQVYKSVDILADDPRPAGSAELGSPDLRRIHIGRYRVIYNITDTAITIVVMHLGRVG